jgi:hypothetical protein
MGIQGNLKGTYWEPGKKNLNSFRPPSQNLKGEKQGTLSACLGLTIGCIKFLFPKVFNTIFGLG